MSRAEAAFECGASRARKFSKPQALQEVIDFGEGVRRALPARRQEVGALERCPATSWGLTRRLCLGCEQ
eukprot:1223295-Pyramimonas_sp.AAC.1